MGFPDGWSDADRYALLCTLKDDMTAFIYTEDEHFAASLEAKLGKDKNEIVDAIRDLMQGLGFAIKSRNFQNEGFYVDGEEIYPFKILHDTMLAQPENRAGGVWDPDELRNGLAKIRTYRHVFDSNPDLFFRRTQIWSKSGPDMRAKFYLWRELYLEEKQKASEVPMSDAKLERVRLLREIFEGVPPPTPSTPTSMASPGLGSDETPAAPRGRPPKSQTPKVRPWSAEEQELLVDLVVQLTVELQTTGETTLVPEIPERVNRTTPSIMGKLLDIRARLESKKSPLRAANIPKVLFDPTSAAHKIFTSNWSDKEDPYALGYHAIKAFHNRYLHVAAKKNRPPPRRMETRQRANSTSDPSGQVTPKAIGSSQPLKQQIHPVEKPAMANSNGSSGTNPPRIPVAPLLDPVYSEFVRDCATMLKKWSDEETYRLCLALLKVLPSRDSIPMSKFYERAGQELGGRSGHDLVMPGERILQLCRKRYGSLACFAAAIEGSDTSTPESAGDEDARPAEDEENAPTDIAVATPMGSTPGPSSRTLSPTPQSPDLPMVVDSPLSPTPPKPLRSYSKSGPAPPSYGKSNEAAMQILNQKASNTSHAQTTPIESSPSTHHFSPDHYDFDYDPGTPEEGEDEIKAEPEEEPQQRDRPAYATPRDDDRAYEEPESPTNYKTSGFGRAAHSDHHHRHRSDPYHHQRHHQHRYTPSHSSRAPGHVHMSSSKTLVIQKTPGLCHCDDCVRRSRRRRRDHDAHFTSGDGADEDERGTSVRHKRHRQEVYAYAATDGHYVHQIAHKRIHHYQARGEVEEEEDDESDEVEEDDMEAIEGMWGKLMGPIQSDIQALEAKRREQQEREQDRLRQEHKQQWKQELRQQVRAEWKPLPAPDGVQTTAFGNAGP